MAVLAAAAVVVCVSFMAGDLVTLYGATVEHSVRTACVAAVIWLSINHAGSLWGRLLECKPLVVVGVLSYSLYLWQQPSSSRAPTTCVGSCH